MSLQRSKTRSQKCSNFNIYSCLAQSVERLTVNQDVTGSSPVTGANNPANHQGWRDFALFWYLSGLCRLSQQMLPKIVQAAHSCLVRAVDC